MNAADKSPAPPTEPDAALVELLDGVAEKIRAGESVDVEARAAAALHHPNIVPVYAVGQERGVHFYAMQFIDGRTLAEVIAERRPAAAAEQPTTAESPPPAPAADTAPAAAATVSTLPGGG